MTIANIRHFVRGAAATASIALLPQVAAAEELSFAHWVPPAHVLTSSVIEPLQQGLAEAGADLTIRVYPGGELGAGPAEQYVRAVQGVADMVWGLQGYTSSQFARTMVAELPGVLGDGRTGYDALWDAWEAGQLSAEYPGTVPVALYTSEPNILIMKDRDIRAPGDLSGLKIRVSGSVAGEVVEALGAIPVQMPAGEIYNALQTGLIDGVVTGASAVADFRLDEVANSYTIGAPLGRIAFFVVMNQGRYDGLSEEQRAALDSVIGRELSRSGEEGWNARADQTIQALRDTGDNTVVDLSEDEIAAFADITLPVTEAVVAEIGAEDVLATMKGE